ncbi:unnamed protein product, partial [Rhizoctonia solani]
EPTSGRKGHVTPKVPAVADERSQDKPADKKSAPPPAPSSKHVLSQTQSLKEECSAVKVEAEDSIDAQSSPPQKNQVGVLPTISTTTANPPQEDPEDLTPKATAPLSPRVSKKAGLSDEVDSLADILDRTKLEDTKNNSNSGNIRFKSAKNKLLRAIIARIKTGGLKVPGTSAEPEPGTPYSKDEYDLHYFLASSGVYCYDDYRSVWSEDGALVNDGSLNHEIDIDWDDDLLPPSFYVDFTPYWCGSDGLFCQDTDGAYYAIPIHTVHRGKQLSQPMQSPAPNTSPLTQQNTVTQTTCDPDLLLLRTPPVDKSHSSPAIASSGVPLDEHDPYPDFFGITSVHSTNHDCSTHGMVKTKPPLSKPVLNKKYCFDTSRGVYYYDDNRKLYTADDTLVYDGSSIFRAYDSHIPHFEIDGISYRFGQTGLSYQDTDGSFRRVDTYDLSLMDQPSTYQDDVIVIQPDSDFTSPYCGPSLAFDETTDVDAPTKYKIEAPSPEPHSNSLYKGLQGGQHPWSPSESQADSPIVGTTTSDDLSPRAPSLFLVTQPGYIQRTRKRGTKDHLVCPECGKECRRPVALKEHRRTHLGQKPELCPFPSCNTGFATKSNMRRHFLTHRAGTLEEYISSGLLLFDTIVQGLNRSENSTPPS